MFWGLFFIGDCLLRDAELSIFQKKMDASVVFLGFIISCQRIMQMLSDK